MPFASYTRYIGIILIIIGVVNFIIMYNFSNETLQLIDSEHSGSCMNFETCPHIAILNQAYLGYGLSAGILIIGLLMTIFGGCRPEEKPTKEEKVSQNKGKWEEALQTLTGDEKLVYEKIMASDGVIFQSDLVDKSGFPKAKVSRILDRMEASGLVERKRRGMANAIVLK
ncbi:MAG: MarR family transcriptional regulator [Candidatus Aenigmarchaeota archaeon]|nr:MarR family transcriptional regulator [Candidatus Aenigmarchaeota archaeon]